jgi:hypothetical protein
MVGLGMVGARVRRETGGSFLDIWGRRELLGIAQSSSGVRGV